MKKPYVQEVDNEGLATLQKIVGGCLESFLVLTYQLHIKKM